MNTTKTTQMDADQLAQVQSATEKIGWLTKQSQNFEKARFGWMAMYLTMQSCLGSIAAAMLLQNYANDFLLALCAVITMISNAVFIAQASARLCLITFYVSIIINTILIIMYI